MPLDLTLLSNSEYVIQILKYKFKILFKELKGYQVLMLKTVVCSCESDDFIVYAINDRHKVFFSRSNLTFTAHKSSTLSLPFINTQVGSRMILVFMKLRVQHLLLFKHT